VRSSFPARPAPPALPDLDRAESSQLELDDGSLQIFGGGFFKDRVFHRVQRVDKRAGASLPPTIDGFQTRRINFTFRFVPEQDVIPFSRLSPSARADVRGYVEELAKSSTFFAEALASAPR
jgi:hypothetical protein